jgi:hypothetical protein
MLANVTMLTMFYALLVLPILWLTRPIRTVNPF